ncbi:Glycosyltransferase [Couchioplanes caeruleus subsp. caeruleus]|uniref:Glycosyltransferase n=2 Tax=Couchioplanes caeruleus TaxID=56438 RepID=A0A1K0GEC5_9ACTN|nr:nucleotide disphospho-sugar-binding domain-containing protein [Couchioplanes caeruleus]OJF15578.1 Glycosyltransferase [Couchioplanes caeruleus subsp. caeruleus]
MARHFAFVPLAAHGHVNPTLALAGELVSRGHRVTYATSADHAPAVARTGAAVVELPWKAELSAMAGSGYTAGNMLAMMAAGVTELTETFDALVAAFSEDRPDCVCFDIMGLPGRALADRLGVPGVALAPNMVGNAHFSLQSVMWPADLSPSDPRLAAIGRALASFAAEQGISPASVQPLSARVPLHLVFVPRAFQIAGDTFGPEFRFLGPSLPPPVPTPPRAPASAGPAAPAAPATPAAPAAPAAAPAAGWRPRTHDRIVLISLGTVFNDRPDLLRICLDAFADSPWHVVLATGRSAVPGPFPANIEVHRHVPQLEVLRHASVFVSHTGMGSTMEALLHGVPLVSVPQTPEQALNGRRAAELGLGLALETEKMTADMLRDAVEDVVADAGIAANLRRWRDMLGAAGGAQAGAVALEEFLDLRTTANRKVTR